LPDAGRALRFGFEPHNVGLFGVCVRCCANTNPGITKVVINKNKFRYLEILFTTVLWNFPQIRDTQRGSAWAPEPQYNGCNKGGQGCYI